jgi:hypothetical protein
LSTLLQFLRVFIQYLLTASLDSSSPSDDSSTSSSDTVVEAFHDDGPFGRIDALLPDLAIVQVDISNMDTSWMSDAMAEAQVELTILHDDIDEARATVTATDQAYQAQLPDISSALSHTLYTSWVDAERSLINLKNKLPDAEEKLKNTI